MMLILSPVPVLDPDPDCPHCFGEGVPQTPAHRFLADDWSNSACPHCWQNEETDDAEASHE
jgi:hypothetical protein